MIFPREAFDSVLSNLLAAAALSVMLYIDAVVPDEGEVPADAHWVRPSMCLWMSDAVYSHDGPEARAAWRAAALGNSGRRAPSVSRMLGPPECGLLVHRQHP